MSIATPTAPNSTVTQLVSGIMTDAQDLATQQISLFRSEMLRDLRKTKDGVLALAVGFALMQIGGVLLCLTLVHLLTVVTPSLSLWMCYGIVAIVVLGLAAIPISMGLSQLKNLNPLPDEAAQSLKENAQWLMNPMTPK